MMMMLSKLATSSLLLGNCLTNNSNSLSVGIPCEITTSNSIFKLQHNVTALSFKDDPNIVSPSMIVINGATNVTIDLNYYTIHGPTTTTSGTGADSSADSSTDRITYSAIQLINSNNVNIMNGNIYGFDYGITTASSSSNTSPNTTSNNKKDVSTTTTTTSATEEEGITIFNTLFSNQSYSAIYYVNKEQKSSSSSSMTIDQSTFECSFTTTTSTTNCIHYESYGKFTLSNSLVEKETLFDLSTDNDDITNHNNNTKINPPGTTAMLFISKAMDDVTIRNNVINTSSGNSSNGIMLNHDISSNTKINIHSNCISNGNEEGDDDDDDGSSNGIIYEQRHDHDNKNNKESKSNNHGNGNGNIDITKNIITGYPIGIYMNQITCTSSSNGNDCSEHIAPKIMYNCIGNSKNVGIWSFQDDEHNNSIHGIRGLTIYENDFFYNVYGDLCIGNELRCGTSVTSTLFKKTSKFFSNPKNYMGTSKNCICPLLQKNDAVGALGLHSLPKDKDVDSSSTIMTEIK